MSWCFDDQNNGDRQRGTARLCHLEECIGDKDGNAFRDNVGELLLVVPADGAVVAVLDAHKVLRVGDQQAGRAQNLRQRQLPRQVRPAHKAMRNTSNSGTLGIWVQGLDCGA